MPRGDFRILEAYVRALRSAQKLIHLESQFLWSPEIVEILRGKLRNPPTRRVPRRRRCSPRTRTTAQDDTRGQLGTLVDADRDDRLLACTLYQPGRVQQVYVHAKIGIVDDRWLCIGSANLNEHSMFNDTEACVITCDEELARETRLRLWREHCRPSSDVDFDALARRGEERSPPVGAAAARVAALAARCSGRSTAYLWTDAVRSSSSQTGARSRCACSVPPARSASRRSRSSRPTTAARCMRARRTRPSRSRSYLDAAEHVRAARETGADAIHPGYGFLAESGDFADAVIGAGPDVGRPDTRRAARRRRQARGEADRARGGRAGRSRRRGRGLPAARQGRRRRRRTRHARRAHARTSSTRRSRRRKREAQAAFGDDRVYLERYLERPRHVEIQLLADTHGTVLALGERECSVQRRHQKVLEESPSPALDPDLRAQMSDAAVRFARAIGYVGAGTAEFVARAAASSSSSS